MTDKLERFQRHVFAFCAVCETVTLRVFFCVASLYGMYQAILALLE